MSVHWMMNRVEWILGTLGDWQLLLLLLLSDRLLPRRPPVLQHVGALDDGQGRVDPRYSGRLAAPPPTPPPVPSLLRQTLLAGGHSPFTRRRRPGN